MSPALLVLAALLGALTLYALLGGADFGAGVWEFNTALRAPARERALLYRAVGPVWEANHVWLIFAVVLLFSGFPAAFAGLCRSLWVPLLLALAGIVFRGVGFAFRSYAAGAVRQQEIWGAVFALASTAAPFFLGACAGAVASGRLHAHPSGDEILTGWINPLSIYSAFFAVGVCAYLAAVYLTREAEREGDATLVAIWRRRAIATGLWMGFLALVGLGIMAVDAPDLWRCFRERSWPMVGLSGIAGFGSLGALWKRRFSLAVAGAGLTVATVLWGWAIAQYPALLPGEVTYDEAKAPDAVLRVMLWACVAGGLLLIPSLLWLFSLFKGKSPAHAHDEHGKY